MSTDLKRELTFWEKAVGLTFNPGWMESVNKAKQLFAEVIDMVNEWPVSSDDSYMKNTLKGMAIRSCITAQMAVVKFLTWKD